MKRRVLESSFRIALMVCLSGCISYEPMMHSVTRNFHSQARLVERTTPLLQTQTRHKAKDDPFGNQPPLIVYPPKEGDGVVTPPDKVMPIKESIHPTEGIHPVAPPREKEGDDNG